MSYILDTVKIHLSEMGYLPNYPYHLISDRELFDCFLQLDESEDELKPIRSGVFQSFYPLSEEAKSDELIYSSYLQLANSLRSAFDDYLNEKITDLPNWCYYYLVRSAISDASDVRDKHDLFVLMDEDNLDDIFTTTIHRICIAISKKVQDDARINPVNHVDSPNSDSTYIVTRPLTPFGDPDIVKYLRIQAMR